MQAPSFPCSARAGYTLPVGRGGESATASGPEGGRGSHRQAAPTCAGGCARDGVRIRSAHAHAHKKWSWQFIDHTVSFRTNSRRLGCTDLLIPHGGRSLGEGAPSRCKEPRPLQPHAQGPPRRAADKMRAALLISGGVASLAAPGCLQSAQCTFPLTYGAGNKFSFNARCVHSSAPHGAAPAPTLSDVPASPPSTQGPVQQGHGLHVDRLPRPHVLCASVRYR